MKKTLLFLVSLLAISIIGFGQASTLTVKSLNVIGGKVNGIVSSVALYGAKGDGVTDDAPAFQAAINSGDFIVVPTPKVFYRLRSTLNFNTPGTYLKGSGKNCKLVSDTVVASTMVIGYNMSNVTIDGLSITNKDTSLTTRRGSILKIQLDTLFTGDTTKTVHDISFVNNYVSGPYGATDGVLVISHRSGFGGQVWNILIDNNVFENMGSSACGVLGEYNKVWCHDIRFSNNVTKHTGIIDAPDGFGISVSGADRIYIVGNYFSDFKTIGSELTVSNYSNLVDNKYDSSFSSGTVPYTFNQSGTGIVALGRDNTARNNKVLDSVPFPPYIVNQDNFKSTDNTVRYYSSYLRLDSTYNSSFKGDTYVKTTTNVQPVIALRLGSTGNKFSACNIIGNSSNNQILLVSSRAKHNIFESSKISGNAVGGTLINASDTSATDNIVKDCYLTQIGLLGSSANLSTATSPTSDMVVDANGINSIVSHNGGSSFTSTLTNTTNITSSGFAQAKWTKHDNIYHVMISGTLTPSSTGVNCVLTFSLPFTTTVTSVSGVGQGMIQPNFGGFSNVGGIINIASGTTGTFNFFSGGSATSSPFTLSFDYSL